jgi:uncharacterized protein (DUF1919 family)
MEDILCAAVVEELCLPHLKGALDGLTLGKCTDMLVQGDPLDFLKHCQSLGVSDPRERCEIAFGLAKARALRGAKRLPPPASLDWKEVARARSHLGKGDCFAQAVLFLAWQSQVKATLRGQAELLCQHRHERHSWDAEPRSVKLISNNCWGGAYVQEQASQSSKPYITPFVGIFMHVPCYIEMLEHLDEYMQTPLTPASSSRYGSFSYPVARWLNSEVHFVHANDAASAIDTFERRKLRFLSSDLPIFVKMDDRDQYTDALGERFLALPYRRLLFVGQRNRTLALRSGVVLLDDDQAPDGRMLECAARLEDVLPLATHARDMHGVCDLDQTFRGAQTS